MIVMFTARRLKPGAWEPVPSRMGSRRGQAAGIPARVPRAEHPRCRRDHLVRPVRHEHRRLPPLARRSRRRTRISASTASRRSSRTSTSRESSRSSTSSTTESARRYRADLPLFAPHALSRDRCHNHGEVPQNRRAWAGGRQSPKLTTLAAASLMSYVLSPSRPWDLRRRGRLFAASVRRARARPSARGRDGV